VAALNAGKDAGMTVMSDAMVAEFGASLYAARLSACRSSR
jgi:hypothetical protein